MKKMAKVRLDREHQILAEIEEKAKIDPELAKKLEVAEKVMERYSEALQKLADS
jgi:hypothetical protein